MGAPRKWANELMVYDADDALSTNEAQALLASDRLGSVTIEGIRGVGELSAALNRCINLVQVSFCTHGRPGSVYFPRGSLNSATLKSVVIPASLFKGEGRLLFMGCETARTKAGEDFLIDAGRHFFAGRGGIVGGSTVYNYGPSFGTWVPVLGRSSSAGSLPEVGKLVLFRLDAAGNVVASSKTTAGGL